jgi:hypothetical protein
MVGCYPHRPGRPSQAIRRFRIGDLRMVLDAALGSVSPSESKRPAAPPAR